MKLFIGMNSKRDGKDSARVPRAKDKSDMDGCKSLFWSQPGQAK